MAQEKGTFETISLGDVVIGRLMTWPNATVARFFYAYKDGSEKGLPLCDDFATRRAFDIWLAANIHKSVKTLAEL